MLVAVLSSGCVKLNPIEMEFPNEYPGKVGVKTKDCHIELQQNLELISDLYDLICNYCEHEYVHQELESRRS